MTRSSSAAIHLGLTVLGFALAIVAAIEVASGLGGYDAHAFWSVDLAAPYGRVVGSTGAFLYPPPAAVFFFALAALLPWSTFLLGWSMLEAVALGAVAGPLLVAVLFLPPVATELRLANIHAVLALAVVVGFRWPWAWSIVLLTKVTPGVGLLWFAFRHEWRSLLIAVGATAIIATPTVLLAPQLWQDWIATMIASARSQPELGRFLVPLGPRLVAATIVVWWGAKRDLRWTVPIASTLALPELWDHGLVILVACIPLAWPSLSVMHVVRVAFRPARGPARDPRALLEPT